MAEISVVHTADNHLDYSFKYRHRLMDRKRDFWRSFKEVLEYVLRVKPDLFLISGDLYHRINPRNPPRAQVLRYFRMISRHTGIFMVGGHHDTPRSEAEGLSPLAVIEEAGYGRLFRNVGKAEAEELNVKGFHVCISGMSYPHGWKPGVHSIPGIPAEGDINIFMVHGNIQGFPSYYESEPVIGADSFPSGLHYVAAGHLHRHQVDRISGATVCYPGSTERTSFRECGDEKGFVHLTLDENGLKDLRFIKVKTRPMANVKIKVEGDASIQSAIRSKLAGLTGREAMVRVKISGFVPRRVIDNYKREEILKEYEDKYFLFVLDDADLLPQEEKIPAVKFTSPLKAFKEYIDKLILEEKDESEREVLLIARKIGLEALKEGGAW